MRTTGVTLVIGALVALPATAAAQDVAEVARGATLYGQTCARCHNLRAPTERTDREWLTIVSHMRARANLARSQAAAILAFLQAANLPEGPATATGATTRPAAADGPGPVWTPAEIRRIEVALGTATRLGLPPVEVRELLRQVGSSEPEAAPRER